VIADDIDYASKALRKHINRRRAERRRELNIRHARTCEVPELDGLDLPPWLHGDKLYAQESDSWLRYYDPEGRPLRGEQTEILAQFYVWRTAKTSRHSTLFYRAGVPIQVSTVYLGLNVAYRYEGPPIVWETMVFTGGTWEEQFCARYATPAAALHGHRVVCDVIRQAQRMRRSNEWHRAPRRVSKGCLPACAALFNE
jgi:hypothetical protein